MRSAHRNTGRVPPSLLRSLSLSSFSGFGPSLLRCYFFCDGLFLPPRFSGALLIFFGWRRRVRCLPSVVICVSQRCYSAFLGFCCAYFGVLIAIAISRLVLSHCFLGWLLRSFLSCLATHRGGLAIMVSLPAVYLVPLCCLAVQALRWPVLCSRLTPGVLAGLMVRTPSCRCCMLCIGTGRKADFLVCLHFGASSCWSCLWVLLWSS